MTKLARKLKRNRLKALRKDTKQRLRHVEESLNNMPSECSLCSKQFDNEEADSWTIKMSMDGAKLLCPECMEGLNASKD